jgi:hypothetical protein
MRTLHIEMTESENMADQLRAIADAVEASPANVDVKGPGWRLAAKRAYKARGEKK